MNEEINCIIPKFVINYEFQEIKHHYYQIVNRLVDGCHQFLVYKHHFFTMENMFNPLCCKKELLHTYIGLIIVSYKRITVICEKYKIEDRNYRIRGQIYFNLVT